MLIASAGWIAVLSFYIYEGLESEKWPSTEGVIVTASAKRINHNKERYVIDANYQYSIGNKVFNGKKVSILNTKFTRTEVNEKLKQYLPKNKVLVYYEPSNPNNAYLVVGSYSVLYIIWLVAFVIFIFSFINIKKLYYDKKIKERVSDT
ncbi:MULTISPECIES: DUF3592 domain-containing protein [unclassified Pseudoalteromonas]|jgi:uncharacterized membrane protein